MHYLINWRMQVVMRKLRETWLAISRLECSVGYESEASFARAFRREDNSPPTDWQRKNAAL
jgi:AraC family transcriptional regulator, alkane utilization regulator